MSISRRQALSSLSALVALPALASLRTSSRPRRWSSAELLDAVRRGDLERVRNLLAAEATLARARDDAGRSAYVLAHMHGHLPVAEALREALLELDVVEAVLAEDWERVGAFVQSHPELVARAHPIGGTPLYAAALVGSDDCYRLRALGCDPDGAPPGGTGFTPARGALESPHSGWAQRGLADLCGNGADVNARQRGGDSILHAAVRRRDEALVRLAVRKGADTEALDGDGKSAAALAAELGWEKGALLLAVPERLPRDHRASRFALDANREPVQRPDLSSVPQELQNQITGSSHFNLDKLRGLVAADKRLIFAISTDDELAVEACAHVQNREIIRFHLDHGAPLSLPTAVALRDAAAVAFWLERDPRLVHERGAHDFPVLWFAVGGGALEIAELMARHDLPIDQESRGTTALHRCADAGDLELAEWLLEHGANPEARGYFWDRNGQTPLQVAEAAGEAQVAVLLKAAGARR